MMLQTCLTTILKTHQAKHYAWGNWDCITFVADCVCAKSGINHMDKFEEYDSELGAMRALRKLGYQSIFGYFMENFEGIPVSKVGVGDLVFLDKGANRLTPPAVVFGDSAINRNYEGWICKKPSDFTVGFRVV